MAALGVKRYETGLLELHKQLSPPSMVAHPHSTLASRSSGTRITWSTLPPQLHPAGAGVPAERRQRKCDQIDSVLAIVMPLASKEDMHIVDFGGGTGAIALPLAGLLPEVTVTIVDVSEKSLAIAQRRAADAGVVNLKIFCGDIGSFSDAFDLGISLHACGEASDLAMHACITAGARFVIAPCCVGKLSRKRMNNVTWNQTGSFDARLSYPRSAVISAVLSSENYDALACAGDFSEVSTDGSKQGTLRRLAKCWLEHDRQLWAEEKGFSCFVCRMEPPTASQKNQILFGWPRTSPPEQARPTRGYLFSYCAGFNHRHVSPYDAPLCGLCYYADDHCIQQS
uniref:Methyltransferase domain-containing protein n=1 Tax=Chrysotila carterae TaxID=13221 RepID=A0A7S4BPJ2_CHRCT